MHLGSIDQAARLLECSPQTVRRRISDGSITGYRVGPKLLRVDLDEVSAKLIHTIPSARGVA